jgi:hypothetical protein
VAPPVSGVILYQVLDFRELMAATLLYLGYRMGLEVGIATILDSMLAA